MKSLGRTLSLLAVLMVVFVAGCGDDDGDGGGGSGDGGGDTFLMGYSAPFLTDPFQAVLQNATVDEAERLGLETLAPTNANQDVGQQITDVRNLINTGAEGLIIVPSDSGMGVTACEKMGEDLGGKGTVLSLQGDLATINGRDRTDGFKECMTKNYPDMQVIERPTKWQTERATSVAQTVLTANPDLAGIYMQSDSVMLAGVLNVLDRAGNGAKVGEDGHIVLVSIDGTPLALEKIRSGKLDAAVSQPLDLYATYGVDYLRKAVAGGDVQGGSHRPRLEDRRFRGQPDGSAAGAAGDGRERRRQEALGQPGGGGRRVASSILGLSGREQTVVIEAHQDLGPGPTGSGKPHEGQLRLGRG